MERMDKVPAEIATKMMNKEKGAKAQTTIYSVVT